MGFQNLHCDVIMTCVQFWATSATIKVSRDKVPQFLRELVDLNGNFLVDFGKIFILDY